MTPFAVIVEDCIMDFYCCSIEDGVAFLSVCLFVVYFFFVFPFSCLLLEIKDSAFTLVLVELTYVVETDEVFNEIFEPSVFYGVALDDEEASDFPIRFVNSELSRVFGSENPSMRVYMRFRIP